MRSSRTRCDGCGGEIVVAFSCKSLGTGYALFAIAYGVMFVLLMRRLPPVRGAVFRRDPYALAYFVAPCFLVQILALSWVGMLGAGNRYSLPLFLPALAAAA